MMRADMSRCVLKVDPLKFMVSQQPWPLGMPIDRGSVHDGYLNASEVPVI